MKSLNKFWFVLAVLLLFPVVALAANNEDVSVDTPKPFFCGSGLVRISGQMRVCSGDTYTVLKVFFGTPGNLVQVYTNTPAVDCTYHDWSTHVTVTQGTSYTISARMYTPAGVQGITMQETKPSEACSAADIGLLLDDLASRLLTIP